jgi:hypothetical protein
MNENDDEDNVVYLDDADPSVFIDPVAQRALAFVALARFTEIAQDEKTKELTFSMMRKITMSIRTPSTAELKAIE